MYFGILTINTLLLVLFPVVSAQMWHNIVSGGNEYLISTQAVQSYTEAKINCRGQSAHVANVKTSEIFNHLVVWIGKLTDPPYSFYIGATRIGRSGSFQWTDGTRVTFKPWHIGDPNDVGGLEDCVVMGSTQLLDPTYGWRDVQCSSVSRYICERKMSIYPAATFSARNFPPGLSTSPQVKSTTTSSTLSPQPYNYVYIIIGFAAVVVVAVIIAVVLACTILKKRRSKRNDPPSNIGMANPVFSIQIPRSGSYITPETFPATNIQPRANQPDYDTHHYDTIQPHDYVNIDNNLDDNVYIRNVNGYVELSS